MNRQAMDSSRVATRRRDPRRVVLETQAAKQGLSVKELIRRLRLSEANTKGDGVRYPSIHPEGK